MYRVLVRFSRYISSVTAVGVRVFWVSRAAGSRILRTGARLGRLSQPGDGGHEDRPFHRKRPLRPQRGIGQAVLVARQNPAHLLSEPYGLVGSQEHVAAGPARRLRPAGDDIARGVKSPGPVD